MNTTQAERLLVAKQRVALIENKPWWKLLPLTEQQAKDKQQTKPTYFETPLQT